MTEIPREPAVTEEPASQAVKQPGAEGSSRSSRDESQPLLAAFAVLTFWLFLSAAPFNLLGIPPILSPLLLLLIVFLLVKGLVRREVRRELARISSK